MRKILLISIIMILLTGCKGLRPYHVDVQQGNIIDENAVAQLYIGLDKSEVSSILGEPLLDGVHDTNTWTYIYTNQINGGKIIKKKLVLEFEKDKLVRIN